MPATGHQRIRSLHRGDVRAGQSDLGPIRARGNIVCFRVWCLFREDLIGAAARIPNPRSPIDGLARVGRCLDHLHEHERLARAIGDLGELGAVLSRERGLSSRQKKWRRVDILPPVQSVVPLAFTARPQGHLHHLGRVARTLIGRDHLPDDGELLVPVQFKVIQVRTASLFDEGKDERHGRRELCSARHRDIRFPPRRKPSFGRVVVVHRQAQLLEIVAARTPPSGFTGRLHRREEQADQRGDDRDHHQQFNEGEGT